MGPLKSCGTYYGYRGSVEIILIIEDLWKCSINGLEGLLLFYQCKHVKELQEDNREMEESFLSIAYLTTYGNCVKMFYSQETMEGLQKDFYPWISIEFMKKVCRKPNTDRKYVEGFNQWKGRPTALLSLVNM